MKRKKLFLLVVLLMAVGFAAVSTTLYINGQTKINANQDYFNVYYSDAKVNGVQDLSVIADDTNITFTTTLETLGQKYVLDYDVTNGSKNYDAELVMECTEGNEYLIVTNEFDTTTNLEALKTRSGKLTLELQKSYAGEEDMDVTITCTIDANAIERDSLAEQNPSLVAYEVGDEITLAGETFNVISQTDDTVTMLAKYVIGQDGVQTNTADFKDYRMWFMDDYYNDGEDIVDLDIAVDSQNYLYEGTKQYVEYLKRETGNDSISGNVITMSELQKLGCTWPEDNTWYQHDDSEHTCLNSENASWLVNGQIWWTRTYVTYSYGTNIWRMYEDGELHDQDDHGRAGLRPVITIDKADLN